MKDLEAYDVDQNIEEEMNEAIEDNDLNDFDIDCDVLVCFALQITLLWGVSTSWSA